jgi:hypothetical protein
MPASQICCTPSIIPAGIPVPREADDFALPDAPPRFRVAIAPPTALAAMQSPIDERAS